MKFLGMFIDMSEDGAMMDGKTAGMATQVRQSRRLRQWMMVCTAMFAALMVCFSGPVSAESAVKNVTNNATSANPAHNTNSANNTFSTVLKNGLKVIIREDHRAPTVVQMVWYRIGGIDEIDGHSGLSHLLEHMMFKGTKEFKAGEFNRLVAKAGGRDNAFTSNDYTAYFQQVPKEQLELMMRLEADRMNNLSFADSEFTPELKVVMEERRLRTEDSPPSKLYEQFRATMFLTHPYRRPVIGWMDDLQQMKEKDARDWYQTWYAPNNATLVIVGDVDRQQVLKWAERYYNAPKKVLPERHPTTEIAQVGLRRIEVKAPAESPIILLGYKVPRLVNPAADTDPYTLQMLAVILDGHSAARLSNDLVRQQKIATSVGASYDPTVRGEGMFYLEGIPTPQIKPDALEQALKAELQKIAEQGVSAAELDRARAQLISAETYKLDSMMGQAMEIGSLEVIGIPYQQQATMIEKLQQVTAAEVQRVAGKYFVDDQLTVGLLTPVSLEKTALNSNAASASATSTH